MTLIYPIPANLNGGNLRDEIAAALGISPSLVSVGAVRDTVEITVPDGSNEATIAATVAAHTGALTPEQALEVQVGSTGLGLTTAQYEAVRQQMQVLRALRQMGRNAFMALTAAERDRQLYDAFTATTQVLLSILRDEG